MSYRWRPLSDLPGDLGSFIDTGLTSLREVWLEQREDLSAGGRLEEFHKRLAREWAIETGVVEQVYSLDRGTTQLLIERGIDASLIPRSATDRDPVLVARMIRDHADVLEGVFTFVKGERALSVSYIKELHAQLTRSQRTIMVQTSEGQLFEKELTHGAFKTQPNNPHRSDGSVHEYCPPEQVAAEMDRMIELHQEHERKGVHPEIEAAWLHHVFTQIHPFEDGNGRVARTLATLVFIRADWFPLLIQRDDHGRYIELLEAADAGNLDGFVAFFAENQRRSLTMAISFAQDVAPPTDVDAAVRAIRDTLLATGRMTPKEWVKAKESAKALRSHAQNRLETVRKQLHDEISAVQPQIVFHVERVASQIPPWLGLSLEPSLLQEYSLTASLTMKAPEATHLVLAFHALGPVFRGLIRCVAVLAAPEKEPIVLSRVPFEINYRESVDDALKRFSPWLEEQIIAGLAEWRKSL